MKIMCKCDNNDQNKSEYNNFTEFFDYMQEHGGDVEVEFTNRHGRIVYINTRSVTDFIKVWPMIVAEADKSVDE